MSRGTVKLQWTWQLDDGGRGAVYAVWLRGRVVGFVRLGGALPFRVPVEFK